MNTPRSRCETVLGCIAAVLALSACGGAPAPSAAKASPPAKALPTACPSPTPIAVADCSPHDYNPAYKPPPGWTGPVFKPSLAFPKQLPKDQPAPWMKYDFKTQPKEYLLAARAYIYEGNVGRGASDWDVATNPVRTWYHMPWRWYGDHGREFVHGLTMEMPSAPGVLDPKQKDWHYTWAVAMYGPVAGYSLGQVWRDGGAAPPELKAASFASGALVTKLLFTTAAASDVPEIEGAYEWPADVYTDVQGACPCVTAGCPRGITTVRLLQIDIAIKDPRATETVWVFGSLVYDKNAPGKSAWDKMVPLGLMWGNDPWLTAAMKDQKPKQSLVFYDREQAPFATFAGVADLPPDVGGYEHLGCHGRLSGPVDNPKSACLSCHATSQYPPSNAYPRGDISLCDDAATNGPLWRNITGSTVWKTCAAPTFALDYSLEMASAAQNYYQCRGVDTACDDPATPAKEPEATVRRYQ